MELILFFSVVGLGASVVLDCLVLIHQVFVTVVDPQCG